MTFTTFQLLALLSFVVIIVGGVYLVFEYGPWPNNWAKEYNVVRRDWESYSAWNVRVYEVMRLRSDTADAFLAEAAKLGNYTEKGRVTNYFLPEDHQLAIAYDKAKKGPHL